MKLLSLLFISILTFPALAQMKVKSKAYDDMLQGLLKHSIQEISVHQIQDNDPNLVFLDARERREYEVSHLKNAVWVGYDDFTINRLKGIDKTDKVVVYCSVGYRSEKVGEKLRFAGYTRVYNLYGSIFEWVNQDRPVYDMQGNRTYKVHAFDQEWGRWLQKGEKVYD